MNGQTTWKLRAKAGPPKADECFRPARAGRRASLAFTLIEPLDFAQGKLPVVRQRKAVGFTLIELLVVISIISLLASIMVPSLNHAMELARRAKCATNLYHVATIGLTLYAHDAGAYPCVPLNGGGWNAAVGSARSVSPYNGQLQNRNPTSGLYLLVRGSLCPAGMFCCPSAQEKPEPGAADQWDFEDGTRVSYALQNPYGSKCYFSDDAESAAVLLADGSPYFDPKTGLRNDAPVVNLAGSPTEDQIRKGNSPNHRGAGQTIAGIHGGARFERRADCGLNADNIYTRAETPVGTDGNGSLPAAGAGSAADQGPAGPKDNYLIP